MPGLVEETTLKPSLRQMNALLKSQLHTTTIPFIKPTFASKYKAHTPTTTNGKEKITNLLQQRQSFIDQLETEVQTTIIYHCCFRCLS